ncbi:four-carbon acid sugar kinase family protein (plasmid) [Agrobacterium tumefaciens]|uniref:four-carbon acid sugar kinase family protein n=1 Tax=Agrobacterium tumefaciens TaxID=358 RepID=UPI000E0C7C47|nr:four-carbon acid sugar kinase family protein [Agrobacterium tumefaciens]WQE43334.1 four-carbon acid sugar kinase family protein [Agrobacterium tumefaciens]
MNMRKPLVGFYGDDFTGSSENLAQFHRNGLRTRLYLRVPEIEVLKTAAETLDVVGFAGTARALDPVAMRAEVEPAFNALKALGCNFLQFKICSTFDSAPAIGNFGLAAEQFTDGGRAYDIAVLAATPDFGRYTAFGSHFARFGNDVVRLDRHPSMSNHPRTPMKESDLKEHLASLCSLKFGNIFVPEIRDPRVLKARIAELFATKIGAIFDGVENDDLQLVVAELWTHSRQKPIFALAAQGLAQLLGKHLAAEMQTGDLQTVHTEVAPASNLLVLSGSCAIQTGKQIDVASQAGWATIKLDPSKLVDQRAIESIIDSVLPKVSEQLSSGRPTIVYTARGDAMARDSFEDIPADQIGDTYARLMVRVRKATSVPRVVLAGGDSSSYTVRSSGAEALTIKVFDEVQHGHLCELIGGDGGLDGLEILLKGGQIGKDDYFLRVLSGTKH